MLKINRLLSLDMMLSSLFIFLTSRTQKKRIMRDGIDWRLCIIPKAIVFLPIAFLRFISFHLEYHIDNFLNPIRLTAQQQ